MRSDNLSILIILQDISKKSAGLSTSTFLRYRALKLIKSSKVKVLSSDANLDEDERKRVLEELDYDSFISYKEMLPRFPSIFSLRKIFLTIQNSSIVYIYSFYQPISYISFLFAKILGKEVWFRPHGSLINTYSKRFSIFKNIYTYFELYLYSFSRYIILSTPLEKNDFLKYIRNHIAKNKLKSKLAMAIDSFDIKKTSLLLKNKSIEDSHSDRNIDLIFLSRLNEIKGIFLLLDSLVMLCKDKNFKKNINIKIA